MPTRGRKKENLKISLRTLTTGDILAIFGIVMTLVFGYNSCRLSKEQIRLSVKQDSTSVSIDTLKNYYLKLIN